MRSSSASCVLLASCRRRSAAASSNASSASTVAARVSALRRAAAEATSAGGSSLAVQRADVRRSPSSSARVLASLKQSSAPRTTASIGIDAAELSVATVSARMRTWRGSCDAMAARPASATSYSQCTAASKASPLPATAGKVISNVWRNVGSLDKASASAFPPKDHSKSCTHSFGCGTMMLGPLSTRIAACTGCANLGDSSAPAPALLDAASACFASGALECTTALSPGCSCSALNTETLACTVGS
mmetsp:Transcript_10042/g.31447  ORF Transcript_10042/g.31447 Transcript_10042/m.31447 type:complete len:246 (-) Transcript_10042:644-1381(-)